MHSRLEMISKALMEACWLAAAALIPLFFNLSSAQTFEPDKMFVLKFLALFSGAAWLLTQIIAIRRNSAESFHSFLRIPLIKPVLVLALFYLLSSVFSIVPLLSWWGLYKRGQGTLSFFCYVVLFLVVATELHRPEQLKRLLFVLILTSIPAAAYSILQQIGADTLPWSSIERSSGTMGNPIFLGGYLAMIVPLTICQLVTVIRQRGSDNERKTGFVLIGTYGVAAVLQVAAILCTKSRGPALGLVVAGYMCALVFFVLSRTPRKDTRIYSLAAASLGIAVPLLLIAAGRFLFKLPFGIALAGFALAVGVSAIVCFLFWRTPAGRTWFWVAWLAQPLALVLLFAVVPAKLLSSFAPSSLGRFSELSDGSVRARFSLWESGIEYLRKGSPAILPEGTHDPYFFLRRAIGYGPECSWLPATIHTVPSLMRTETVQISDRMHNEILDDLLTVGIAGSAAFLVLLGAGFLHSLRLLGFARGGNVQKLFLSLAALGVLAGTVIPFLAGVPRYMGIGVEIGLLAGVLAFILWSGFRQNHEAFEGNARQLLVLGILGGLIAHLIEIGVGIEVAPTHLYLYLFLALLSVLSARESTLGKMPAKTRRSRAEQGLQDSLIPYTASAGFVILTLSWCFTFNSLNEQSLWAVFWKTWFSGRWTGLPVSCALLLIVLTIAGSLGLLASEKSNPLIPRSAFRKQLLLSGVLLAAVWMVIGLPSAEFWTALSGSFPAAVSSTAESRITFFLVALFLLLLGTASILSARVTSPQANLPTGAPVWLAAIGLFICAVIGTHQLVLRPAWADIAFRIAEFFKTTGNQAAAVQLFERTSNFAPHEATYQVSLGLAQNAAGISDPGLQVKAGETLRHALDLNPLDPAVCRTVGTFHAQLAERSSDPALRVSEIKTALSYLKRASLIAPQFPDAYSDMGRCYFLMGDYETASSLYQKALDLSPRYSRTYMFLGEMQYRRGNLEQALKHFGDAAKFDTNNIEARKNVGFLLALLGRSEESIRADLDVLKIVPRDSLLLTRLAVLYFGQNNYEQGLEYARRAYDAMPASGKGSLEEFIEKLKNQGK